MISNDKAQGMLLGLAAGDAVGTSVEFKKRGSFTPVSDMQGGGPFDLQKGQWTDDTSMALCLAASLLEQKSFDPADQMRRYLRWRNDGYLSSTGKCFDIGLTVQSALNRYLATGDPMAGSSDPHSAGNGSLMRLAPVILAYHRDQDQMIHFAGESSKTTHACEEAVESCKLFARMLYHACLCRDKHEILNQRDFQTTAEKVRLIAEADYLSKSYDDLSGSGYVIESLQSALWCFNQGEDFKQAILLATNIGNDADTTAAICGQIAGAFYGCSGIPKDWVDNVAMSQSIQTMASQLVDLRL